MDAVLDIIMSLFSDFDVNAIIEMLSSFIPVLLRTLSVACFNL